MAEGEMATPVIHADTKHEIGVMVGFAAIMALSALAFFIAWKTYNKRQEKKEVGRKAGLLERGFGELEKGHGVHNGKGIEKVEQSNEHGFGGDGSGERVVGRADGKDFA